MASSYIQFVNDDPATILAAEITRYQGLSGRVLGNGDPEMLVITSFAYRLAQIYQSINITANQNLLRFASGPALDALAEKFGVYRLPAAAATCLIQLNIVGGAPTLTIPSGMRIKSQDGLVMFAVNESTVVTTGTSTVVLLCTCLTPGIVGNGYTSGMINIIVDPQPYVASATNTETSTGGSDVETDDELRARVPLANATFSVAGPEEAYQYFAKTADAAIMDVSVVTGPPGTVTIYALLDGGVIPGSGVLDAILAICDDKKVRPLTDTVLAVAPTEVDYSITANLAIKAGYNSSTITDAVTSNLLGFTADYALGKDILGRKLTQLCMDVAGMYDVDLGGFTDVYCDDTQFAKCTSITVNVVEIVNEV